MLSKRLGLPLEQASLMDVRRQAKDPRAEGRRHFLIAALLALSSVLFALRAAGEPFPLFMAASLGLASVFFWLLGRRVRQDPNARRRYLMPAFGYYVFALAFLVWAAFGLYQDWQELRAFDEVGWVRTWLKLLTGPQAVAGVVLAAISVRAGVRTQRDAGLFGNPRLSQARAEEEKPSD